MRGEREAGEQGTPGPLRMPCGGLRVECEKCGDGIDGGRRFPGLAPFTRHEFCLCSRGGSCYPTQMSGPRLLLFLVSSWAVVVIARPSQAATLVNGSFENLSSSYVNTPGADSMSGVAADAWTVSANSPDWFLGAPGPAGLWSTPWGDFFAVGAAQESSYREGISQTITGMTIGTTYTLEFQQANGLRYDQGSYIGVGNTGGWEVLLDGVPLISSGSLNDNSSPAPSFPGSWNLGSVNFVATATSQTIEFLAYGGSGPDPTFQFLDSVTITESQVPEPGIPILCALASLGLCKRRRTAASH